MTVDPSPPPDRWQAASPQAFGCGGRHPRPAAGTLDESRRRLSHEELAVARILVAEGHAVVAVAESRGRGRRPDLMACERGVEVKAWLPREERAGVPGPASVFNKLRNAAGQADAVVLYSRQSGLSEMSARRGLALFAADPGSHRLGSVRVVGDGYDLSWRRGPELRRPPGPRGPWVGLVR